MSQQQIKNVMKKLFIFLPVSAAILFLFCTPSQAYAQCTAQSETRDIFSHLGILLFRIIFQPDMFFMSRHFRTRTVVVLAKRLTVRAKGNFMPETFRVLY
jgi:hypothetical protein